MEFLRHGIGIDVAKEKFDVCISIISRNQVVKVKSTRSFNNGPKGFEAFLQ